MFWSQFATNIEDKVFTQFSFSFHSSIHFNIHIGFRPSIHRSLHKKIRKIYSLGPSMRWAVVTNVLDIGRLACCVVTWRVRPFPVALAHLIDLCSLKLPLTCCTPTHNDSIFQLLSLSASFYLKLLKWRPCVFVRFALFFVLLV